MRDAIAWLLLFAVGACFLAGPAMADDVVFYGTVWAPYKQKLENGGGCVSGSVGTSYDIRNFSFYVVFASEKNSDSYRKHAYFGYSSSSDIFEKNVVYTDGAVKSSIFTMCLKPGRYELVGLKFGDMVSKQLVHVPFVVEAGKHVYLGSFVFHQAGQGNCPQMIGTPHVEVRDEHERDIPRIALSKKAPKADPVVQVIEIDASAGKPYFVACGA
ncbi:hypothetical protein [Luteimonas panaciterrae]|uniref:hypothetical protein n=1 Tax=Luteimonas panaciterrae TaxID=363885 RepID=UPI001CFB8A58|nr:hypothetical protein [Luteimonas panaciterrae]